MDEYTSLSFINNEINKAKCNQEQEKDLIQKLTEIKDKNSAKKKKLGNLQNGLNEYKLKNSESIKQLDDYNKLHKDVNSKKKLLEKNISKDTSNSKLIETYWRRRKDVDTESYRLVQIKEDGDFDKKYFETLQRREDHIFELEFDYNFDQDEKLARENFVPCINKRSQVLTKNLEPMLGRSESVERCEKHKDVYKKSLIQSDLDGIIKSYSKSPPKKIEIASYDKYHAVRPYWSSKQFFEKKEAKIIAIQNKNQETIDRRNHTPKLNKKYNRTIKQSFDERQEKFLKNKIQSKETFILKNDTYDFKPIIQEKSNALAEKRNNIIAEKRNNPVSKSLNKEAYISVEKRLNSLEINIEVK